MKPADFWLEHHGSLWLVRPMNIDARVHLRDNVADDAQWFGDALVVEPRYVNNLADALEAEGWRLA